MSGSGLFEMLNSADLVGDAALQGSSMFSSGSRSGNGGASLTCPTEATILPQACLRLRAT